jgi:hypothetical protein
MSADGLASNASDAVAWYDHYADGVVKRHESIVPEKSTRGWKKLLPANQRLRWTSVPARGAKRLGWLLVAMR